MKETLNEHITSRPQAVAAVFIATATVVPRAGRVYDEWLHEVTERFKRAWKQIERQP